MTARPEPEQSPVARLRADLDRSNRNREAGDALMEGWHAAGGHSRPPVNPYRSAVPSRASEPSTPEAPKARSARRPGPAPREARARASRRGRSPS